MPFCILLSYIAYIFFFLKILQSEAERIKVNYTDVISKFAKSGSHFVNGILSCTLFERWLHAKIVFSVLEIILVNADTNANNKPTKMEKYPMSKWLFRNIDLLISGHFNSA